MWGGITKQDLGVGACRQRLFTPRTGRVVLTSVAVLGTSRVATRQFVSSISQMSKEGTPGIWKTGFRGKNDDVAIGGCKCRKKRKKILSTTTLQEGGN